MSNLSLSYHPHKLAWSKTNKLLMHISTSSILTDTSKQTYAHAHTHIWMCTPGNYLHQILVYKISMLIFFKMQKIVTQKENELFTNLQSNLDHGPKPHRRAKVNLIYALYYIDHNIDPNCTRHTIFFDGIWQIIYIQYVFYVSLLYFFCTFFLLLNVILCQLSACSNFQLGYQPLGLAQ